MTRDTIKRLAEEIKFRWPELHVQIEHSQVSTDRQIGRLRWPGKGRTGTRIVVKDSGFKTLLDHNNAETYRRTSDVRAWMERYATSLKTPSNRRMDRAPKRPAASPAPRPSASKRRGK